LPTLIFETDPPSTDAPAFDGDTSDLVNFMSFVVAYDYGSTHELAQLAQVLRRELGIRLTPLATFYDAEPEDDEDRERLEKVWQEAGPLRETCERILRAFAERGERLHELSSSAPRLEDLLRQLASLAARAEERGARVRLSYRLD
jgi:hypothetical protein